MSIDKETEISQGNYNILLKVTSPDPKLMVLQVISYQTIVIEIDKSILGKSSYKFNVKSNDLISSKANNTLER